MWRQYGQERSEVTPGLTSQFFPRREFMPLKEPVKMLIEKLQTIYIIQVRIAVKRSANQIVDERFKLTDWSSAVNLRVDTDFFTRRECYQSSIFTGVIIRYLGCGSNSDTEHPSQPQSCLIVLNPLNIQEAKHY